MFWKKGYQDPKHDLETMIVKPKAVEKKLLWNQNCEFEIKTVLTLAIAGARNIFWQDSVAYNYNLRTTVLLCLTATGEALIMNLSLNITPKRGSGTQKQSTGKSSAIIAPTRKS